MMIRDKHGAVLDWCRTYSGFDGYLKLNATEYAAGENSLTTTINDQAVTNYINGSADKVYTFTIVMIMDWSSGFDDMNQTALEWGSDWLDWVAKQYEAGNVPDFGDNVTIYDIEALQNMPQLAEVDQDSKLAKYTFSARIDYRERAR